MKSMLLLTTVVAATTPSALAVSYEQRTGCEKTDILWQEVEESEYFTRPDWNGLEPLHLFGVALNPIRALQRRFFAVTMEETSDFMPSGRNKGIHTYGSVAQVAFVPDSQSPFTGVFRGVDCGLVRLSLAAKPSETSSTPGMAVKFLIDNQPSLNFMAMYSLDGQSGHNFFANDFSNFVEPPKSAPLKILAKAFGSVTKDPTKVDVAYMAGVDQYGQPVPVEEQDAPTQLYLVPNQEQLSFSESQHDVRDDFAQIEAETVLYRVYGRRVGEQQRFYAGDIVTKSRFIASEFGDKKLFFRHERYQGQ